MPPKGLFADFLTLPLGEVAVLQRVQLVLSLWESELRNATYKQCYVEQLDEIVRLEKLATEKESLASDAVNALQAPIVTVTKALVDVRRRLFFTLSFVKTNTKVLHHPDFRDSQVKTTLCDLLELMTHNDVYRPAMQKVFRFCLVAFFLIRKKRF